MSKHTGPGYWKITNGDYIFKVVGDKIRRKKRKGRLLAEPWIAIFMTDNPYANKKPGRFKTQQEALSYAVSGGEPFSPAELTMMEER